MVERSKAYESEGFIHSVEARPVRIMAEYAEPLARFHRHSIIDTIVFMGSARFVSAEVAAERVQDAVDADAVRAAQEGMEHSVYYEAARQLAFRLTNWAKTASSQRYVVCTGGGPGIMEAANRGAWEAGGLSIGLTISLPHEEFDNKYMTPDLHFHFHYFFMRKFWFTYLAKAVIMMPGGFGTLDELFEILTLAQTRKMTKRIPICLFGSSYWDEIIDFQALVKHGVISPADLSLFHRCDSIDDAYEHIVQQLTKHQPEPGAVL
jgi:uncharacterized protein (TIGR00730 family)